MIIFLLIFIGLLFFNKQIDIKYKTIIIVLISLLYFKNKKKEEFDILEMDFESSIFRIHSLSITKEPY